MTEAKKSLGVNEFVAGCMAGFAQVAVGQPFDIVKVRLQTQDPANKLYNSAMDCLKKIMKTEGGPLALWKGSLPPLIGVGAAASIQFGVNENTKAWMKNFTGSSELGMLQLAICGSVAGVANYFISAPAEHLRIRMQSQGTMANPPYKSSMDCFKKIYGGYGVQGIFKGGVATIWREFFAYAVYFSMYDWTLRKISNNNPKEAEMHKIAFSGAFAGILFWFSVYPIDMVKTKIQIDSFENPQFKSTMDCFRQIYKTQGFGGFWKGLTPCLLRAIPVNSGSFVVYESTLALLSKSRKAEKLSMA
jgi:solute carrier family 25 carnitine/acylcarnitine transporter 20/29